MRAGLLPLLLLAPGAAALSLPAPTAAPSGALGVAQLSLQLSDDEREQRRLSPETLLNASTRDSNRQRAASRACRALRPFALALFHRRAPATTQRTPPLRSLSRRQQPALA